MARVPYLSRDEIPEPYRYLLDERPINLIRAVAHSPDGLERFQDTGKWMLRQTSLDPRLRELVIIRVGVLTGNTYEYCHHLQLSEAAGLTDADRSAVADPAAAPDLDPAARLVLAAADQITRDCALHDDTWSTLASTLGVRIAVELILIISHYNAVARVLGALAVDVEPGYQPYLDRFPLPDTTAG